MTNLNYNQLVEIAKSRKIRYYTLNPKKNIRKEELAKILGITLPEKQCRRSERCSKGLNRPKAVTLENENGELKTFPSQRQASIFLGMDQITFIALRKHGVITLKDGWLIVS